MTETKTENIINYLSPNDFFKIYPLKGILSSGTYGIVYLSQEKYAVKRFGFGDSILELAKELNIYASYLHPCILKPRAWTVQDRIGYLAMDRGKPIQEAYDQGIIDINQIVSDTLSALAFLNTQGIIHGDLKPSNIIYHNGFAKLIDMGLARKAQLSEDGEYYVTGNIYTSPYKDIEYCQEQENNIKCEVYALAMTYIGILTIKNPNFGDISTRTDLSDKGLDWFINRARRLQEKRPTVQTLLIEAPSDLVVRRHTATRYQDPLFKQSGSCGGNLSVAMNKVVKMLYKINSRAETLFLALHLLQRVYQPLLDQYKGSKLGTYSYNIMIAVVVLTTFISNDKKYQTVEKWSDDYFRLAKEVRDVMIDVMVMSSGIISTFTYWDYASSKEDLFPLLQDTISCQYNPKLIRKITKGSDKCVGVQDFISRTQLELFDTDKTTGEMWAKDTFDTFPVHLGMCRLEVGSSLSKLEALWASHNPDLKKEDPKSTEPYYAITLHNRDQLPKLNLDLALRIYAAFLHGGKPLDNFVLNTICGDKWRTMGESLITKGEHPFN